MKSTQLSFSFLAVAALAIPPLQAAVLFTGPGQVVASTDVTLDTGSLARDNTASDTLYFRYTVYEPVSNHTNENYFAALQLFEGSAERLAVGNGWFPHAYSAFNTASGDVDLNSATPEANQVFQLVRATDITTIVIRVDFVPNADDNITVWLNPDFNLTEAAQAAALTTTFAANATFDNVRIRHGSSNSWDFRDIMITTTAESIGFIPEPSSAMLASTALFFLLRRRRPESL